MRLLSFSEIQERATGGADSAVIAFERFAFDGVAWNVFAREPGSGS